MINVLKPALAAIATIVILDLIWLGYVTKSFYVRHMGEVGNIVGDKIQPVYWSAGIVYILLAIGIVFFVLPTTGEGLLEIFLKGALLGMVVYGVYDFTNLATLKSWPLVLALADTAWGAVVCGAASVAAALSLRW